MIWVIFRPSPLWYPFLGSAFLSYSKLDGSKAERGGRRSGSSGGRWAEEASGGGRGDARNPLEPEGESLERAQTEKRRKKRAKERKGKARERNRRKRRGEREVRAQRAREQSG